MTDGIVFLAYGPKAEQEYHYAMDALKVSGNDRYPSQRFGGDYAAANKQASRHGKTQILEWSGYDRTLYMDADTRARESLKPIFDILTDGWDIVMSVDGNQDQSVFWHVDGEEREATLQELGLVPLQLQCGVMGIARNERTAALFKEWCNEWRRYSGEDQAAFVRALYKCPVKIWLMGKPWNGGAAISHNWGAMR